MGITPVDRNQLNTIQNSILKTNGELSSGKKKLEPSQKALVDRFESSSRGLSQALRNLDLARGTIEVAQSGLSEVSDQISEIKSLTLQYKNTSNADDKATIKQEIDAKIAQIDQVSGNEYDGGTPLQSSEAVQVQVGEDAQDTIDIASTNVSAQSLGLSGYDPSADDALQDIEAASQKVQVAQSQYASTERRFQSVENNLLHRIEASEAARSRIEDVDFADAFARKTRDEIVQKSQIAILAQTNRNSPDSFLRLLQQNSRPRL